MGMWKKHEKGTGANPVPRRAVTMSDDGKLSISATLMDELGRPDTVDVYPDHDDWRVGIVAGTDYRVSSTKGSTVGTVCTAGALSALGIIPELRVARPRFDMVQHEGRPMLVVWPDIKAEGEEHGEVDRGNADRAVPSSVAVTASPAEAVPTA